MNRKNKILSIFLFLFKRHIVVALLYNICGAGMFQQWHENRLLRGGTFSISSTTTVSLNNRMELGPAGCSRKRNNRQPQKLWVATAAGLRDITTCKWISRVAFKKKNIKTNKNIFFSPFSFLLPNLYQQHFVTTYRTQHGLYTLFKKLFRFSVPL